MQIQPMPWAKPKTISALARPGISQTASRQT